MTNSTWTQVCHRAHSTIILPQLCCSLIFLKGRYMLLLSAAKSISRVRLCATPQTAAHQAPPSLGFSRKEHWSGLPFLSPMHESEKWKGRYISKCVSISTTVSFKLGLDSTWTENFQMYKLDLEKAEEPEIKLSTSAGSQKMQGNSPINNLFLLHWQG